MKSFTKKLINLIPLFLILISSNILAQPEFIEKVEADENSLNISYEKYKLPNGMYVIIHEDHSDPIVHVRVSYHVGSARETMGKSGFAHFFEHMMFQGSENVGDEEHFKIISEAGGTMNGFTTSDNTVYFETIPVNQLETALWLEADRMGFLLDAVTTEKFEVQRKTVKNEKSQNQLNIPYGMTGEKLGQTLYPPNHPYSWPVIGYVDDLDRADLDDLKEFFMRWYGPNNAILAVAGDVTSEEVLKYAEKYFGPINPGPQVRKQKFAPVILPIDRYGNFSDNIYLPLTLMVFPTVPNFHRDEPALDMLASLMGDGNNSIFYEKFVKSEKAIVANVAHPCRELAGEFTIQIIAYHDLTFNETEEMIRATIDDFEKQGIKESDVERVKTVMVSNIVNSLSSIAGKAGLLTSWQMHLGRTYNLEDEIARYKKVTRNDIMRVFAKYIKNKNAAIVNVYPRDPMSNDSTVSINPNKDLDLSKQPRLIGEGEGEWTYTKPKDDFDRNKHPTPGPGKTPVVPKYYQHTFNNGIKLIGTETHEIPKVFLNFTIRGGDMLLGEDVKKMGISTLTANMIDEATKNFTTEEISAKLDKLGSTINFSGGSQSSSIYVQCFSDKLDETLTILEEKLLNPAFNDDDFSRVKKQTMEALKNQRSSADYRASVVFNRLLYGESSTLGHSATDKTIKRISQDDVIEYYKNNYSPKVTTIVAVGDIKKDDLLAKLQFLEKWTGNDIKMSESVEYPEIDDTKIYLVHKEYAPSSVIIIGHMGMKYDATGEYFKAKVMNYALGGAFNSRINLNLREDKGWTYGARSYFSGGKFPGPFMAYASVRRSATDSTVREIMKELNLYTKEGIKDEELSFTKSALLNNDVLQYETPGQKGGFLANIIKYDLPTDFIKKQETILKGMKKDEINLLAQKYIHPDKMNIVVVGNKYVVKRKLDKLGYKVKEVSFD